MISRGKGSPGSLSRPLAAPRTARKPTKPVRVGGDPVFLALLKHHGIPQPAVEYQFMATRKWRFDYAWPVNRVATGDDLWPFVALEVQGGIWLPGGGRHQRGAALLKEHEKLNRAACHGWRVLYVTPSQLCTLGTITLLREALGL